MTTRLTRTWPALALALVIAAVLWRYGDLREPSLCNGDEALTALRARSLLHAGHFWTPHWNGTVNLHKPPFYYWAVAVSYLVFGVGEVAVRLPSVLFYLCLLLMAYVMAARLFGRVAGLLAAGLLSVHPVLAVQSRTGMMDTLVILLFMTGGWCLWQARERPRWFYAWGAAGAAALLTKGGGAILGLPASLLYLAAADRAAFRRGHLYGGLGLLLLLPGVWFGSQYLLHREAFLGTYVAWEVNYRLTGHNPWQTFLAQKTTRLLWQSFGALAPAAVVSVAVVLFRRESRERLFLPILLVTAVLLTNFVKQQMFWYVIPGVVPMMVCLAGAVGLAATDRLSRPVVSVLCLALLGGTFLPGVSSHALCTWAGRAGAVAGLALVWLPAPARRLQGLALCVALLFVLRGGMAFDNPRVNFAGLRDSADLKVLAQAVPAQAPDQPVVLDFKYYPMNVVMFYSDRNAVQADGPERPPPGTVRYGIFRRPVYRRLPGVTAEPLQRAGKYELVKLTFNAL